MLPLIPVMFRIVTLVTRNAPNLVETNEQGDAFYRDKESFMISHYPLMCLLVSTVIISLLDTFVRKWCQVHVTVPKLMSSNVQQFQTKASLYLHTYITNLKTCDLKRCFFILDKQTKGLPKQLFCVH